MIKKILYLIEQSGVLMNLNRSHKKFLGTTFDTVASHSHHTAIIAYALVRMENLSHEEALKAVAMAVFHDVSEARIGDLDFIAKHYAEVDVSKANNEQFFDLPFADDLKNLVLEYEDRQTLIAKCTKDADSLDQLYQEWILMWQGNKMAEKWFMSDFNDRVPGLKTESAKKIANEMKGADPQDWWWSQFMENDTAKDMEKLIGKK
jgi:putative hydrolase of HD superfamily